MLSLSMKTQAKPIKFEGLGRLLCGYPDVHTVRTGANKSPVKGHRSGSSQLLPFSLPCFLSVPTFVCEVKASEIHGKAED